MKSLGTVLANVANSRQPVASSPAPVSHSAVLNLAPSPMLAAALDADSGPLVLVERPDAYDPSSVVVCGARAPMPAVGPRVLSEAQRRLWAVREALKPADHDLRTMFASSLMNATEYRSDNAVTADRAIVFLAAALDLPEVCLLDPVDPEPLGPSDQAELRRILSRCKVVSKATGGWFVKHGKVSVLLEAFADELRNEERRLSSLVTRLHDMADEAARARDKAEQAKALPAPAAELEDELNDRMKRLEASPADRWRVIQLRMFRESLSPVELERFADRMAVLAFTPPEPAPSLPPPMPGGIVARGLATLAAERRAAAPALSPMSDDELRRLTAEKAALVSVSTEPETDETND